MSALRPFYIGQRVVCINEADWFCAETGNQVRGPKYGDVCTVSGYEAEEYVLLHGYSQTSFDGYNVSEFRPLPEAKLESVTYSKVLEEELISVN